MLDRIELRYELTRDDWLAINDACLRESPEWTRAASDYRRNTRRQVLYMSPILILLGAFLVQRSAGSYLTGAGLGLAFATFLYFALPRVNAVDKAKQRARAQIEKMDFTAFSGPHVVEMDEHGVVVHSAGRDMRLSWQVAAPTHAGRYIVLEGGGASAIAIPLRAFESDPAGAEMFTSMTRWWQMAQLPHAERLARYLASRNDLVCPACKYSLRGAVSEKCPECGRELRLEEFTGTGA